MPACTPSARPIAPAISWNTRTVRLKASNVATSFLKGSTIRADQCADKAASFAGQLHAYREALAAQGLAVRETWIHFPLSAIMADVV